MKPKKTIVEEKHGDGSQVIVHATLKVQNKNSSLAQRIGMTNAFPTEQANGYGIARVGSNITVLTASKSTVPDIYAKRTTDEATWHETLRHHREQKTQFTDSDFPPDSSSIFHDVTNKKEAKLDNVVKSWRRISDFFTQYAYAQVSMYDDDRKLVCGISLSTTPLATEIAQVPVDSRFIITAQDAVASACLGKRREHCLLLTKTMIEQMTEYVDNNKQRFEAMWVDNLLNQYKPLEFCGVGKPKAFRVPPISESHAPKVVVIVPILFQANRVRLFQRNADESNIQRVGDVRQGRLSNCYFMGALATLATCQEKVVELFPEIPMDLRGESKAKYDHSGVAEQQYNEEGVYAVRFWRQGKIRVVVIDDWIPCNQNGRPCFAGFTSNGFEIWSMLVEKAYAKLNGSYESLTGGQEQFALADLVGGVVFRHAIGGAQLEERYTGLRGIENLYQTVHDALSSGSLLLCEKESSDNADGPNVPNKFLNHRSSRVLSAQPFEIRDEHAYGIVGLAEVTVQGQKHRLVQLRNSWDHGVYQGSWSRYSDDRWKLFSKEQLVQIGATMQSRQDDGTWWMDFDMLQTFFSLIIEARDVLSQSEWTCFSIHSGWNGSTAAGRLALHLNPQYHLVLPPPDQTIKTSKVILELEQCSRRPRGLTKYDAFLAATVAKNGTPGERKINLTHDIIASGTYISNRIWTMELDLPRPSNDQPLVLIPSTYESNQSMPFHFMVYVKGGAAIYGVDDQALPKCNECSEPLMGSFRTFSAEGKPVERICGNCIDSYRAKRQKTCAHCNETIQVVPGRFDGRFYSLDDGTHCHSECIDAYRLSIAEKCGHCHEPICAIEGKFNGKFFITETKKVHAECMEAFQKASADQCQHCREPVLAVQGKFCGKFYKVPTGGSVHFECWETYQSAHTEKCKHCAGPVIKIEGRFDGRFYELQDGSGKVHFECWDAYRNL